MWPGLPSRSLSRARYADGLELPLQAGQVRALDSASSSEREAGTALVVALPAAPLAVVEVVIAVPQQAGQVVGRGGRSGRPESRRCRGPRQASPGDFGSGSRDESGTGAGRGHCRPASRTPRRRLPAVARRAGRPGTTRRRCRVRRGSGIPGRAGCRAHRCAAVPRDCRWQPRGPRPAKVCRRHLKCGLPGR